MHEVFVANGALQIARSQRGRFSSVTNLSAQGLGTHSRAILCESQILRFAIENESLNRGGWLDDKVQSKRDCWKAADGQASSKNTRLSLQV